MKKIYWMIIIFIIIIVFILPVDCHTIMPSKDVEIKQCQSVFGLIINGSKRNLE